MKKLYLVDVSSMFFRAFYAIPPLRTSSGLPTNALYGFLSMSIKLLRENRPDYMAFCFDRKEPSFRHEIYEEYKAHRTEMPEDLAPQIPYIRTLAEKLGVHCLDKSGFEADDLIGTLACEGAKRNMDVFIVSGDKDFAQLVSDKITLYDTMREVRYGRAGVIEKWGVDPEQMIDYLALVGDASDNIPGVKGVGPIGAQKLLSEFKTLENIYENLDQIKSESVRKKLIESKKEAFLAKKLVTIETKVPLDVGAEDLALRPIDQADLKKMFTELEFESLSRKLFAGPSAPEPSTTSSQTQVFESAPSARARWTISDLKKNIQPGEEIWAVLTERGFCLGVQGQAVQVDAHLKEVGEVLSSKNLNWKGFDLKNIWHALKMGEVSNPKWDSLLAGYVIKAGPIEDFASLYARETGKKIPDLAAPEGFLAMEMELEPILTEKLNRTRGLSVLERLDLPLVPILYEMERRGILIDSGELKRQSRILAQDIELLEKEIHQMAGESFNVASPKQLGAILFEKMKVPVVKRTKTGYSTDSDVLSKLAPQYPICERIILYREYSKLKSTYVDALPALVDPVDHRLHTHFHQALTQTGRLSSANPNLQNIPIRTERGRSIRQAFIAKRDHVLLSVDYSQIELRVLAEITGDPGLREAFKKDQDIHAATAAEIFGITLEEVTPDQRRIAKAVNFGIAYGQGAYGLSETLEISQADAKKIIENYFSKFKKVKEYMLEIVSSAKQQGYVETLFGRRRYIDEFNSSNQAVRKFGERAAINAPMQGTASDLMKIAMIEVHKKSKAQLLLQVHDELLFECATADVQSESENIKKMMESVADFKVPLRVHAAWGTNWEDAHA